ncbi:hypothetical protein K491DRAFT_598406 [Lophiostoma macrostomum CBS 122681]|uniref:Uncharacterized protein n=1 Tax=Lophiostoma macrostomum CBS 122681 TaxID=1314788 RepID=A0A6A6TAQ9_9PLEO|nr:hypothetical protein K491DRAFT_598406 [Lophiostoma macrostomum CBS 122681]
MANSIEGGLDSRAGGPFISENYQRLPISRLDIIFASIIFGLTILFAGPATYIGARQTRACRRPLNSVYIWMIWLEIAACLAIAFQCLFFLLNLIRPSFYFYFFILVCWSIQVQCLLQIIVNRLRVILPDKQKGKKLVIGVAVFVTLINISVFCIWLPARLQISRRFIHLNEIWDRIEKVLFFLVDATLNWYFIREVKANLVRNGLHKYDRLARFNQRIIIVSLLMDILIIGAMSIPNGFVYAICHPLAYLVKLNIELVMANLIKKIATADSQHADDISVLYERATSFFSEQGDTGLALEKRHSLRRLSRFMPMGYQIRKTQEYSVHSMSRLDSDSGTTTRLGGTILPETRPRDVQAEQDALPKITVNTARGSVMLKSGLGCDREAIPARPEPVLKHRYDRQCSQHR